jgi:lysophospholipase L1-like esterase
MLECFIMGDSIAAGLAQFRPECQFAAQIGIGSRRYVQTLLSPHSANTIIISLGVNDDDKADTLDNLRQLRAKVQARTVIWLLPGLKEHVRSLIRQVAAEHRDRTLDTRAQAGRDHLHPTSAGYQVLADVTRRWRASSPR